MTNSLSANCAPKNILQIKPEFIFLNLQLRLPPVLKIYLLMRVSLYVISLALKILDIDYQKSLPPQEMLTYVYTEDFYISRDNIAVRENLNKFI